jgi:hypothetical protein
MQPQKGSAGRISGRHIIDRIGVGGGLHSRTALLDFRISHQIGSEYLLIKYQIGGSCELHFLIFVRTVSLKLFKNNLKCTVLTSFPDHYTFFIEVAHLKAPNLDNVTTFFDSSISPKAFQSDPTTSSNFSNYY